MYATVCPLRSASASALAVSSSSRRLLSSPVRKSWSAACLSAASASASPSKLRFSACASSAISSLPSMVSRRPFAPLALVLITSSWSFVRRLMIVDSMVNPSATPKNNENPTSPSPT